MSDGITLISPFTIFRWSCLMLKGSTVNGKVPVNMANILTPLRINRNTQSRIKKTPKISWHYMWLPVLEDSHRPHVHFRAVLPVGQQFRSSVSRAATLSVQKLQRERVCLQSVTQTKVYTQTHSHVIGLAWIYNCPLFLIQILWMADCLINSFSISLFFLP